jgi:hypothetical protein
MPVGRVNFQSSSKKSKMRMTPGNPKRNMFEVAASTQLSPAKRILNHPTYLTSWSMTMMTKKRRTPIR